MKKKSKNINMYGLPSEIKYCNKCNMSNQQPTTTNEYLHNDSTVQEPIDFDNKGVCAACNFNKLKWNHN